MTTYFTLEEARGKLGSLVKDAVAGRPSVITYHGVPAAIISGFPFAREIEGEVRQVSDSDSGRVTDSHRR